MVEALYILESSFMHTPSFDHPEHPKRARMALNATKQLGLLIRELKAVEVDQPGSLKLAERIHAKGYLDYLVRLVQKAPAFIDEDTYISKDSLTLALAAFYYSYTVALSTGKTPTFIILRPPGHHAGVGGKAMGAPTQGFCLLNNASAAVLGFEDNGLRNIVIIDFDAHHGNGTMEIFYKKRILQLDFHQDPDTLYPYTGYPNDIGEGEGYGYKLNVVLPPHGGDDLFTALLNRVQRILELYSPEALVVSAGFDAYINDGLTDLALTEISYYELGRVLGKLGVPTVVVLEGGYSIGLERGLKAFIEGLSGIGREYKPITRTPSLLYRKAVETVDKLLAKTRVR